MFLEFLDRNSSNTFNAAIVITPRGQRAKGKAAPKKHHAAPDIPRRGATHALNVLE